MPFRFRTRQRSLSSRTRARRTARLAIEPLEQRLAMATWGFTSTFAGASNGVAFSGGSSSSSVILTNTPTNGTLFSSDTGELASYLDTVRPAGTDIIIHASDAIRAVPGALAAFERAAEFWESVLFDPIVVEIDIDLASLGLSDNGQSTAYSEEFAKAAFLYSDVRESLVREFAPNEAISLPFAIQPKHALQPGFTFVTPTNAAGDVVMHLTRANAKSLGFTDLIGLPSRVTQGAAVDAAFTLNSELIDQFDFDTSDGLESGKIEGEGAAIRLIARALGLVSGREGVIQAMAAGASAGKYFAHPYDLFYAQGLNLMTEGAFYGDETEMTDREVTALGVIGWDTWNTGILTPMPVDVSLLPSTNSDSTHLLQGYAFSDDFSTDARVFVGIEDLFGTNTVTLTVDGDTSSDGAFVLTNSASSKAKLVAAQIILPQRTYGSSYDERLIHFASNAVVANSEDGQAVALSRSPASQSAVTRKMLTLRFGDFDPGESLRWSVAMGTGAVSGDDLRGATLIVYFDNGLSSSTVFEGIAGNSDAAVATVVVDHALEATVGYHGDWQLTSPELPASGTGVFNVHVTAFDLSGGRTASTFSTFLALDSTPPAPPVFTHISPDTGISSTDRVTTDTRPTVFGVAEPFSSVEVLISGPGVHSSEVVAADAFGQFSFRSIGLLDEDGRYQIMGHAIDASGNVSEVSDDFNFEIDLEPAVHAKRTFQNVATRVFVEHHPGLVGEITHFRIRDIQGGTLYLSDGITVVPSNSFVPSVEGAAGLIFEPNSRYNGRLRVSYARGADFSQLFGDEVFTQIRVDAATNYYAVAADEGGGPHVQVYDARTGVQIYSFFAFNPQWKGGARVAVGDVNADGVDDIVVGAGPGGGPHVKVFNGIDLSLLGETMAYGTSFRGGVYVAVGNVVDGITGYRTFEIITGAGPGGGPHVKVWTLSSGRELVTTPGGDFFAFDLAFRGGVTVAATQIDDDYLQEIVVGAGPGGGPHVRVFDDAMAGYRPTSVDFFAYDPSFKGGVFVAGGPLYSGFTKAIVTGAGASGTAHVKVFNATNGAKVAETFAYDPAFTGGVRVALLNVDRDDDIDIITAPGRGGAARIRAFDGRTLAALDEFFAFEDTFLGGAFAAAYPVRL